MVQRQSQLSHPDHVSHKIEKHSVQHFCKKKGVDIAHSDSTLATLICPLSVFKFILLWSPSPIPHSVQLCVQLSLAHSAIQWSHFVTHCGRTFCYILRRAAVLQKSNAIKSLEKSTEDAFVPKETPNILTIGSSLPMVSPMEWQTPWILVSQFLF